MPSRAERTILTAYLGGEDVAGKYLKVDGTSYWTSSNTGTNSTGFTAYPGGIRDNLGKFDLLGLNGVWWSATGSSTYTTKAWYWAMSNLYSPAYEFEQEKQYGNSVRCLHD